MGRRAIAVVIGGINRGSVARRRQRIVAERMLVTARDRDIVRWVFEAQLATREQVQRLFFTCGGRSRCQRRLTLLYRNRFLDRLPGRAVSAPEVYYISRRSIQGLRLLRTLCPDTTITPHQVRAARVQHTLEVASVRIAFVRACVSRGYSLSWLDEAAVAQRTLQVGVMPDGFAQISRPTAHGPKVASFFLEVERSAKTTAALTKKLRQLGDFYYSGLYAQVFGARALRVLLLVDSDYGIDPTGQIRKFLTIAANLDVTFLRVAALSDFLTLKPAELFRASIWQQPGSEEQTALIVE